MKLFSPTFTQTPIGTMCQIGDATLYHADNMALLGQMADNSVDAIVTDAPYGLKFMGKRWDYSVPSVGTWAECLRVLKPGGHLLAFASPRTQHRMAVNIEDAGFEIRDMMAWIYGSGMAKSHDVSKAIDREAGEQREVIAKGRGGSKIASKGSGLKHDSYGFGMGSKPPGTTYDITAPATDAAKQWEGWGTALKPALEPITVARKPLAGTVAANVLEYGTGAINIDGCRIETIDNLNGGAYSKRGNRTTSQSLAGGMGNAGRVTNAEFIQPSGRWPANLMHDGSPEVLSVFPTTQSGKPGKKRKPGNDGEAYGEDNRPVGTQMSGFGGKGSAARFFYCAKVSRAERGEGNNHPTVKPMALMRYLCRLVTPPGGIILDPYMGSGSTGVAALAEGFRFVGCDIEHEYFDIAVRRMS